MRIINDLNSCIWLTVWWFLCEFQKGHYFDSTLPKMCFLFSQKKAKRTSTNLQPVKLELLLLFNSSFACFLNCLWLYGIHFPLTIMKDAIGMVINYFVNKFWVNIFLIFIWGLISYSASKSQKKKNLGRQNIPRKIITRKGNPRHFKNQVWKVNNLL